MATRAIITISDFGEAKPIHNRKCRRNHNSSCPKLATMTNGVETFCDESQMQRWEQAPCGIGEIEYLRPLFFLCTCRLGLTEVGFWRQIARKDYAGRQAYSLNGISVGVLLSGFQDGLDDGLDDVLNLWLLRLRRSRE